MATLRCVVLCGLLIVVASRCGAQALVVWALVALVCGLSSCGLRALELWLSSCSIGLVAPWHVASQTWGQIHVPSLAGGFLTTRPPAKPEKFL